MIIKLNQHSREFYLSLLLHCDPQIGDTACQIRAIIFLDLFHHLSNPQQFEKLSKIEKDRIADFIECSIFLTEFKTSKTLEPLENCILAKLTPKEFLEIHTFGEFNDLLSGVSLENYKKTPFNNDDFKKFKQSIEKNPTLKRLTEKIEFSDLDPHQADLMFLNQYLERQGQTKLLKVSKLKSFFNEKRQFVANEAIRYLKNNITDMRFTEKYTKYLLDDVELYQFFKKPGVKEVQKIGLLPNFISTSIMLYKLQISRHIVCLVLNCSNDSTSEYQESKLFYRHNGKHFEIINSHDFSPSDAVLEIKMEVHLKPSSPKEIETCFKEENIDIFLTGFKKIPLEKLILLCSAAHQPVPGTAHGKNLANLTLDFPSIDVLESKPLSDIDIHLEECSSENYTALNGLAQIYGLFHEQSKIQNPVINIKHIHINTRSEPQVNEDSHALLSSILRFKGE